MFDLTNEQSFLDVDNWFNEIKGNSSNNVVSILIGSKSDLVDQRQVSFERASSYAKANGLKYLEVSSKNY